jgi:catechol 2,3-dioxygenase-like lactoylglutathione lyase family enzyme
LLVSSLLLIFLQIGQTQLVKEIEQVVISVNDLGRSEDVYTSVMGYKVHDRGEGTGPSLPRLWNLPPGTEMKWVLLEKQESPASIQIRLVQFTPVAPRSRYQDRTQDGGYADLHICSRDVISSYKTLIEKGFTALHEPILWRGCGGEFGVGPRGWWEVFMHGLDGEGITLIPSGPEGLPGCPPGPDPPPFSPILRVIISVTHLEEAYIFYRSILGWEEFGERWEAFGPDMETMVRLPMGTVARPIFLHPPGNPSGGGININEYAGAPKIDLYARNGPPHRGLIMMTLKTDDVERLYKQMVSSNVKVVMPPIEVSDRPYGGTKAFSLRGPDGVFIEFVGRKSP